MNREKRRSIEEQNEPSIGTILDNTERLAEKASRNIRTVTVSKNSKEVLQRSATIMEDVHNKMPMIKKIFLEDDDDKKCVVNALAIPRYEKNLKVRINQAIRNQYKGLRGSFDYIILHDLSANKIEVKRTLETLETALPVMIQGLKSNDTKTIKELKAMLVILERRIYHLYCFYGHYLNEIGKLDEYNVMYQFFTLFDDAFRKLMR